jgi:hypothetical protein
MPFGGVDAKNLVHLHLSNLLFIWRDVNLRSASGGAGWVRDAPRGPLLMREATLRHFQSPIASPPVPNNYTDGGLGCSSWAARAKPPSDDDDDDWGADYDVFYPCLGMR